MSIPIDGVFVRWPEEVARPTERPPESEVKPEEPGESAFRRVLETLGATIDRGERIVAGAASGYAGFDAAELIALQAGIYRYSEAVDLAAKLVDRTTGAVRTVLQGH